MNRSTEFPGTGEFIRVVGGETHSGAPSPSDACRSSDPGPRSLEELEARVARDLHLLGITDAEEWLEPRVDRELGPVLDVAIVGAGMAGLSAALALKCLSIRNIRIFDRALEGFEGPWATFARMKVLRSPKELTGPALRFSNLTFRAWFEAQFGSVAWTRLQGIPRLQWMDYLRWYRRVIDVPIENESELVAIKGGSDTVILTLRTPAGTKRVAARHAVLASGRDGFGGPHIPEMFRTLDRRYWSHANGPVDFAALRNKTVAVIGAGASSADNAAAALEAGAARVGLLIRRNDLPRIHKGLAIGHFGLAYGFQRLTAEQRWSIIEYIRNAGVPAPYESMLRCTRHKNFSLLAGCAPVSAVVRDDRVHLDTNRGTLLFDHLIVATGSTVDWDLRPELAALAPHVLRWKDRFAPDVEHFEQADEPHLGPDLEFQERIPGAAPWVSRIHCFSYSAHMSHGALTIDIAFNSQGAECVAAGIAGALFAEDYALIWQRLNDWNKPVLPRNMFPIKDEAHWFMAADCESAAANDDFGLAAP